MQAVSLNRMKKGLQEVQGGRPTLPKNIKHKCWARRKISQKKRGYKKNER